jgi:23S rRNA (uracil1939-C5)-methyltransferase
MTYGCDAIAHTDGGKTVFVSGGLAGDVVDATITSDGKSFSRARVDSVVQPSPDRVTSACPLSAVCGGCPWASLARPAQLAAKQANVEDALTRTGHLPQELVDQVLRPIEDPGPAWGYRNKVELAFQRRGGRALVGMHAAASDSIVKVTTCPLLSHSHSKLVKSVSGSLAYLAGSHDLALDRVGIRASDATGDVEVALWGPSGAFPRGQASRVLAPVKATSVVRVMTRGPEKARRIAGVERLSGTGSWHERVLGEDMRLSAPSFFQVNTKGAERLVELVLEGLAPADDDVAMDLYSGAGTFTLPLARRCSYVAAVESYGPAVRDLRRNLESSGLDNVDAVGGDADREFPDEDADVIVVDPPRAGLAPHVVEQLSATGARAIAYVSCDPATLARDLARFREAGTFEPVSLTPVDLFPQTFHVECVTILARAQH